MNWTGVITTEKGKRSKINPDLAPKKYIGTDGSKIYSFLSYLFKSYIY